MTGPPNEDAAGGTAARGESSRDTGQGSSSSQSTRLSPDDLLNAQAEAYRRAVESPLEKTPGARPARPDSQKGNGEAPRRLLVPVAELLTKASAPDFVIGGVIESDSIGTFFGAWGSGKTLVMFDLALSVALGLDVHGRPVKQGPVVYVAGEGAGGLARRFAAWTALRKKNLEAAPAAISTGAVTLLENTSAANLETEIHQLAVTWERLPVLIVIDTVSRCFAGGNENSSEDMARFVDAVDKRLRQPFGAAVALAHHTGHEARERGRGSSVLPAAADVEYRVERLEETVVRLVCTKSRDFAPPPPLSWRITPVPLMLNDQEVDSVAVEALPEYTPPNEKNLSDRQEAMFTLLQHLQTANQHTLEAGGFDPAGARVTLDEWREAGIEAGHIPNHRNHFYRVKQLLTDKGLISVDGPHVQLTEVTQ